MSDDPLYNSPNWAKDCAKDTPMDDKLTVFVLKIINRYGNEMYLFTEESVARKQLYEYVKDVWEDRFPEENMPDDEDTAVSEFFDLNEETTYVLFEEEVREEPVRD